MSNAFDILYDKAVAVHRENERLRGRIDKAREALQMAEEECKYGDFRDKDKRLRLVTAKIAAIRKALDEGSEG